jgi:hypothetical protein
MLLPDLEFHPGKFMDHYDRSWLDYDCDQDDRRTEVIKWFDEHGIAWQMCGHFANENIIECPHLGQIYIDVPYDESDPQYQLVRDYIENPDETLRDENVRWNYLSLITTNPVFGINGRMITYERYTELKRRRATVADV